MRAAGAAVATWLALAVVVLVASKGDPTGRDVALAAAIGTACTLGLLVGARRSS